MSLHNQTSIQSQVLSTMGALPQPSAAAANPLPCTFEYLCALDLDTIRTSDANPKKTKPRAQTAAARPKRRERIDKLLLAYKKGKLPIQDHMLWTTETRQAIWDWAAEHFPEWRGHLDRDEPEQKNEELWKKSNKLAKKAAIDETSTRKVEIANRIQNRQSGENKRKRDSDDTDVVREGYETGGGHNSRSKRPRGNDNHINGAITSHGYLRVESVESEEGDSAFLQNFTHANNFHPSSTSNVSSASYTASGYGPISEPSTELQPSTAVSTTSPNSNQDLPGRFRRRKPRTGEICGTNTDGDVLRWAKRGKIAEENRSNSNDNGWQRTKHLRRTTFTFENRNIPRPRYEDCVAALRTGTFYMPIYISEDADLNEGFADLKKEKVEVEEDWL